MSVVFLVIFHLSILPVFPSTLALCLSKVFRQTILPSCPWCSSLSSIYLSCQSFPPHFLSAYLRYFVRQYSRRVRGVPRSLPSISLARVFPATLPVCLSKVFRQTILPSCPWCSSLSSIYLSCQSFPPHLLSAYLRYFVRQYSRHVRGVPRFHPSIYIASLSRQTCSLPI